MAPDERVRKDFRRSYKEPDAQGSLLSKSQLDDYYAVFRQQFGPEVLQNLDGEALLEKIHGRRGSRDSLVYWLEFKNDEEFPARFGSISDGTPTRPGKHPGRSFLFGTMPPGTRGSCDNKDRRSRHGS